MKTKKLDDICLHTHILYLRETNDLEEEIMGKKHYYLNCLNCKTTLLRDDKYLQDYKYNGVQVGDNDLYVRYRK